MKHPSIYKRDNGYWYVIYYISGKEIRKSLDTKNKTVAINKLKDFTGEVKGDMLLSEFINMYTEHSDNKNPVTINEYKRLTKEFLSFAGDRDLREYYLLDFDRFISLQLQSHSKQTVHGYRKRLISVFNKALDYGYITKNHAKKTLPIKLSELELRYFTKMEFRKLISVTDKELYRDIFTFAVLSGLRMSELIHLKPSHILDDKLIKVVSDDIHKNKSAKTRFVELHPSLIAICNKYQNNEFIFMLNSSKLDRCYLGEITKEYIRLSGINPKLHFKAFRSTFGKWLLDENVNLKFISQQLGHASITTTEKHYAKYITTEYRGELKKVVL